MKKYTWLFLILIIFQPLFADEQFIGEWRVAFHEYTATFIFNKNAVMIFPDDPRNLKETVPWGYDAENERLLIGLNSYSIRFLTDDVFELDSTGGYTWMQNEIFIFERVPLDTPSEDSKLPSNDQI